MSHEEIHTKTLSSNKTKTMNFNIMLRSRLGQHVAEKEEQKNSW